MVLTDRAFSRPGIDLEALLGRSGWPPSRPSAAGPELRAEHDVDVVTRLDQEVEAGDAVDLEGDRLLARLQLAALTQTLPLVPRPIGFRGTWLPAGIVVQRWLARRPATGRSDARAGHGGGIDLLGLDLVGRDRVADGDVRLRDEHRHGRLAVARRCRLAVEEDDDPDEGQDGEQHADQDDQAIRSLHGDFPS